MITYPKSKINKRWDSLPLHLREVLASPAYGETVFQVAENHHLNEIKSEKLMKLAGYVIFGFIHPEELDDKIVEDLDIDKKASKEISEELDRKIFSQFREEILDIYSPVSENSMQVESIKKPESENKEFGNIQVTQKEKTKPDLPKSNLITPSEPIQRKRKEETEGEEDKKMVEKKKERKENIPKKKDEPFMIHREAPGANKEKDRKGRNKSSFSFSLGNFFNKEKEGGPAAQVRAPGEKDEEKTVHYSEWRSSPSSEDENSFINTPDLNKNKQEFKTKKDKHKTQNKNEAEGSKINKKTKKEEKNEENQNSNKPNDSQLNKNKNNSDDKDEGGPSVSGNTIDLSKF